MRLSADNIILYLENPKDSTKKYIYIYLINKFSKTSGYKINMQKSYSISINNELSIKEIITIASETIKYVGINFKNEMKDLKIQKSQDTEERNQR